MTDPRTHTMEFVDEDGSSVSVTATWTPAPAPPAMLVGSNRKPLDLARYPNLRYIRLFGAAGKGIPSVASLPAGVTPHVSFKDTPTAGLLGPWLAALDRPVYLTWHHEPEGDMTPTAYRAGWASLHEELDAAGAAADRVTTVEIFTLYAQTHGKTPWPQLWSGYADAWGLDCYNTVIAPSGYPDPVQFFGLATFAAAQLGVPFLIPELGTRIALDDTAGYGAAAWYRDCADYLREQGCRAVAVWDQMGANSVDWTLTSKPLAAWQAEVASQ